MPPAAVDLIVTSPPYNIKNSTGNGLKCGRGGKWPQAELINGYDGHDDSMPRARLCGLATRMPARNVARLKARRRDFLQSQAARAGGINEDPWEIVGCPEFPLRQIIVWQRDGGINFNPTYFLPTYEVIYFIAKPGHRLAPKANKVGDVWRISQNADKNDHPAPFPLELASRCVQSSPGEVVMDPFMGSGTTAIAAMRHRRRFIGVEKSPQYCKMARARIKSANRELLWSPDKANSSPKSAR